MHYLCGVQHLYVCYMAPLVTTRPGRTELSQKLEFGYRPKQIQYLVQLHKYLASEYEVKVCHIIDI